MADRRVDLHDPYLFGNDAAEDEEEAVFNSYVIDRDESAIFTNPHRRLAVVRAYKGDGKSALLRLTRTKIVDQSDHEPLIISAIATDVTPRIESPDPAQWARAWKGVIFDRLAATIGTRIGFAWRDDDMSLVEEAERRGFKERNIISGILDRIKAAASAGGVELRLSAEKPGVTNSANVVQRWAEGRDPIWLLIDDVDQNFKNDRLSKVRVASFFVACRELVNAVPELRIRAAIRPNVWTTLKLEFDALSHVEQYVSDLHWSEHDIRTMLARRIEAHWERKGVLEQNLRGLPLSDWQRDKEVIAAVFGRRIEWGGSIRPAHVVLYTLSKHRPRWVIELCKFGAQRAIQQGRNSITREDLFFRLAEFGGHRMQDTIAEFGPQCPEVGELIGAFAGEKEQFSTAELMGVIERKVLTHLAPTIVGVVGRVTAREVAHLLFEIGFIFPREDFPDATYRHVPFAEKPSLLRSRTALDEGMLWEIHPVFRQALGMRDELGQEVARRPI